MTPIFCTMAGLAASLLLALSTFCNEYTMSSDSMPILQALITKSFQPDMVYEHECDSLQLQIYG